MTRKTLHLQWVMLSPGQTDPIRWFNIVHDLYFIKNSATAADKYIFLALIDYRTLPSGDCSFWARTMHSHKS